MATREEALAELYSRGALNDQQKSAVEELARRGALTIQQPQAQPEQAASFKDQLLHDLSQTGKGVAQAAVNVANIPAELADVVKGSAAEIGGWLGIGDSTYTPTKRIELPESLKPTDEYAKMTAEILPYLVPMMGQEKAAAAVASAAKGGRLERLATAVSQLAAEAMPGTIASQSDQGNDAGEFAKELGLNVGIGGAAKALEGVAGAAYRTAKGSVAPELADVVKFADENKLPLYSSDVAPPKTFFGKSAQAAGEKIPITGTGGLREAQQEARSSLIDEYSKRFGEYSPSDIVESLQRQTSRVKQAAGSARSNISKQMSGVNVSPDNAVRAIDDEIRRLSTSPSGAKLETADEQTIQQLQRYRNDLIADQTFDNLDQLRTTFRVNVKGERKVVDNRSEAAINRIYSAMTKDMDTSIASTLGDDVLPKWKQANAIWAGEMEKIKKTRIKQILDKGDITPEVVNNMLFSKKPSETMMLYNSLDQKGKAAMRSGFISKAMESSGGSPEKFLSKLKEYNKGLNISFKGDEKAYLDGLTKYLDYSKRSGQASVLTPTGQSLFQVGVPAAVAADVASTSGLTTAGAFLYGGMARVYESKPIRNAILRLNGTKKGTTAFEKQAENVQRMISSAMQGASSADD
ncbi:MAG: lytic transglycosylase domain-containing protein [Plesiomonas shigelloides]